MVKQISSSVGPCSYYESGDPCLLSLTSLMFQYLVMTEISGYSSISVASCSPITRFFSSASIKSGIFLPKEKWSRTLCFCLQQFVFQKDQVHFILFSCSRLFIHLISFHVWHKPSDRDLDQTAPGIWFFCSGIIPELFMIFSEQEICIILWFDSINKIVSQWLPCSTLVLHVRPRTPPHPLHFWILAWLAVRITHISLIDLIRHTLHQNISEK
jgi:hypothetical protein